MMAAKALVFLTKAIPAPVKALTAIDALTLAMIEVLRVVVASTTSVHSWFKIRVWIGLYSEARLKKIIELSSFVGILAAR